MKSKGKRKNTTDATPDVQNEIVETKRGIPGNHLAGDPRFISS